MVWPKTKMKIINDLNLKKQAEDLGISIWQTPGFLFVMMGLITLVAMTATFYIAKNYDEPEVLVVAECVVVVVIFSIGNSVIREVDQMARANKLKTEFVFVASHQLRTPVSAIRWETELMLTKRSEGLNQKQRESIERIAALCNRMTRLVADLLDVARIDQGKLTLRKQSINPADIIDEVLKSLMSAIKEKNLRIVFNKNQKITPIIGDPEKVKLVLDNLISNAVKYTLNHGRIEIRINQDNGFLIFTIQDSGVGIPESQQGLVFDKFFRSDNVVKYQTEGTGLGLYIAKNIIEQSGGRIWFKSKEDIGSIFSFSLPIFEEKKQC
jgi:signal transduction histidine kinase